MNPSFTVFGPPQDYLPIISRMESYVEQILQERMSEQIWFLEHPSLYTMGIRGRRSDFLKSPTIPIYETKRGGEITYHGPGQRIVYLMMNLTFRGRDLHHYVWSLEEIIIKTLREINVKGERRSNRVGVWVEMIPGIDKKIAAIGIRVKKWVSYHGFALNIHPDLSFFQTIVPCGLPNYGVTSLAEMGIHIEKKVIDDLLKKNLRMQFA